MKKLSKLFLAMILAFTSIVVFNPNQTKAQEASTYAMGTNVPVYDNTTVKNKQKEYNGFVISYHVTISGSYYLTGNNASNFNFVANYQKTPNGSILEPFTKSITSVQSGNYVVTTLKVGFKYAGANIEQYHTYTYRFLIP